MTRKRFSHVKRKTKRRHQRGGARNTGITAMADLYGLVKNNINEMGNIGVLTDKMRELYGNPEMSIENIFSELLSGQQPLDVSVTLNNLFRIVDGLKQLKKAEETQQTISNSDSNTISDNMELQLPVQNKGVKSPKKTIETISDNQEINGNELPLQVPIIQTQSNVVEPFQNVNDKIKSIVIRELKKDNNPNVNYTQLAESFISLVRKKAISGILSVPNITTHDLTIINNTVKQLKYNEFSNFSRNYDIELLYSELNSKLINDLRNLFINKNIENKSAKEKADYSLKEIDEVGDILLTHKEMIEKLKQVDSKYIPLYNFEEEVVNN